MGVALERFECSLLTALVGDAVGRHDSQAAVVGYHDGSCERGVLRREQLVSPGHYPPEW